MGEHRPRLVASSQRLREPIANCDVRQDMEDVSKKVCTMWKWTTLSMVYMGHSTGDNIINSGSSVCNLTQRFGSTFLHVQVQCGKISNV